jgi:hypothetical protein
LNRFLVASVIAVVGALTIGGSAVAAPVGRAGRAQMHRSCRSVPKRPASKRTKRRRCPRAKRRGRRTTTSTTRAPVAAPTITVAPATLTSAPATTPPPPVTTLSLPAAPDPLPSAWDRPALSDPTTVQLTPSNDVLVLDQSQDYILDCPQGTLELPAALNVWGGRNVVLENCDIDLTNADWAARFSDQSATLWMHDVHFGGSDLTGGIQLQEPGATVVMRDVLFDRVYGSLSTNHAELIQTWAGPDRLMIDGLTGSTTYQGLFLEPNQYYNGPPPAVFDLRHIDIDDSQGAYALWLDDVSGAPPDDVSGGMLAWNVQDLYVVPNPARTWPGWWQWPQPSTGDPTWDNVLAGAPPGGSYVHATSSGATGVDEDVSPPALLGEQL